jgi:phage terminase Nu1 subunit (DNA packaging protein)
VTVTSALAHAVLGIKPATLRKWVQRGHVRKLGRDLYDADTVIAHWRQRHADAAVLTDSG